MALHELQTADFVLTTQHIRKVDEGDEYNTRKLQKDRRKARKWITALLEDREVVVFYKDENNVEKMVIGTLNGIEDDLLDAPLDVEVVNNKETLVQHHVRFFEFPSKQPYAIHIDKITHFICKSGGTIEISNSIHWVDD